MKVKLSTALLACCLCVPAVAAAQALEKQMPELAASLTKALAAQKTKNVAAIDFTDLQGQPTELGRFLSEQLSVEMVLAAGVSVLDRANIKSILAEHKLTEEGLVNPANAKKLGEFAGVDAILIGNVTALDDGIVLTVKAVSTDSAKIVAAGRITIAKTSDIQQLLNRSVSSQSASPASSPATGGSNVTSYQESKAIATKEVGSLHIVLKSVLPVKVTAPNGRDRSGIRCSFEFTNRDTQRPVVVALNAEAPQYAYSGIGGRLRTTILDERGGLWSLTPSAVTGVGVVGVGARDTRSMYNPAEITSLLLKQDEPPNKGPELSEAQIHIQAMQRAAGMGPPDSLFGATSEILPGQSTAVSMDFAEAAGAASSGAYPTTLQLATELVVGVGTKGTKKSYSLHTLTFDRIGLATRDGR